MKKISKMYKWLITSRGRGLFSCVIFIFCSFGIGAISSHKITQSEIKKVSDDPPSIAKQKREATALLSQIKKEIDEGILLISRMQAASKRISVDNNVHEKLRIAAQQLKLAGKDREIGEKQEKMRADPVDGLQTKDLLKKEIGDLNDILDSAREINDFLKEHKGGITPNTKNDAKTFYLRLKKAAEETNKIAQKKRSRT
jgi:hypothetical protein